MNQKRIFRARWALEAIVFLMLGACGGGSSSDSVPVPPPVGYTYSMPADRADGWTVGSAPAAGIDVSRLEQMMNDIRAGQHAYIDSVAIAMAGLLVFDETIRSTTDEEDARVANTDPEIHAQFSASKSITSLVVGIVLDEGYIDSVDVRYLDLFEYPSYQNMDARKQAMTLDHVLSMQAGIEWNEWDPPYSSPDNQLIRFYETETDYSKAFLDLPMTADPGTEFAYNTAATVSLGQAVENAVPMSLVDFGLAELMLPLSITDIEFIPTPTGLPNGGGGFYFRTRDMVKFGQLLLDGGSWNGERIVSEDWVAASLVPRTEIGWNDPARWDWQIDGYGYQWWLGHYDVDGERLDTYAAWGFGGQWVVAVPAKNLVVAVNADGYDNSDEAVNQAHELIVRYVLPALP